MKILETLQKVFAKGPKQLTEDLVKKPFPHNILRKEKDKPKVHHHNHGSSTT